MKLGENMENKGDVQALSAANSTSLSAANSTAFQGDAKNVSTDIASAISNLQ